MIALSYVESQRIRTVFLFSSLMRIEMCLIAEEKKIEQRNKNDKTGNWEAHVITAIFLSCL